MKDDPNRGTGRTTGLILQAIGMASINRGESIEFFDHYPHTHTAAQDFKRLIAGKAMLLNLKMDVFVKGSRVFVRSMV